MNVGRYLPPSRAPWSVFGVAVALFSALHCLTACRLFEKSLETSLTQDPGINVAIGNNFGDGPHIHAFDAYPREVLIGQPVTVTWFAPLADSVEIVALYGTFPPQTNLPPTGSILIWPDQTLTYQLIAKRRINDKEIQTNRFLTIYAEKVPGPPTIWSFRLDRNGVAPNEMTTLRWRVRGCSWVRIVAPTGLVAEKECLIDEDVLPVNSPESVTYTLELLNSNRQLITLAQTTLEVIKEVRAPLITRFETNDPSRTLVDAGSTITLFWETDGATEVRLAPDPSFVGSLPDLNQLTLSGMIYAQPKQDTTYVLTAVNGPKVTSRQVRIRVSPAVTITRFDANPPATDAQGQTLLTWSAENCAQAELSGPRWQEQVPCAGSKAVTLSASATLTLKAWSAAGTFVSRDFSVLVAPPQPTIPRIDTFAASASRVPAGESLKLSWATSHAGRVQLRGLSSPQVAPQGSLTIKPKVTSTFTLEVYAAGASAPSQTWPLAIEVYRPELKINQFRASKNLVPLGSTVTLSWDIVACNSLQIYSLSVSSKKPIHTATGTCKGTFKASVKKGTTFRLVASGSSNTSRFADVVVLAGQDEVDGWFNMLKQVPND